jgi:hypothetical protein
MAFQNHSECLSTFQKFKGGVMDIQKEKTKKEFWAWAKTENPRLVENAELGDVYAIQNLDHMFMGFAAAKDQAVPEWISVKDNLPPANILVLGMSQTRSNIFNIYNVMALDEFEEADVTHWMPLPDAPQEPAND